jgi:hypothetical protein
MEDKKREKYSIKAEKTAKKTKKRKRKKKTKGDEKKSQRIKIKTNKNYRTKNRKQT